MNVFQIHPHDNVAVAVDAVAQGSVVTAGGKTFTVCQDIPAGHKVALQPIAKGEDVIKYGFPIGTAKVDIPVGAWVHTQNVQSKLGDLLHYTYEPEKADRSPWKCEKKYEFFGYKRTDGSAGIRNEVWIIPTVGCVNNIARAIETASQNYKTENIDGIYAYSHPHGCSQLGDDQVHTQKILSGLIHNPNAGAVLDPANVSAIGDFCTSYLDYFNTGIHYSFIASVCAMLLSLCIFLATKKIFPTPGKKTAVESAGYTEEEKIAMAKEIKQRMYALFAVLGVVIFFWFSFHQNGQSLSFFARDFVNTSKIAPEIWQAVNPFFVIVLTPVIMWLFGWLGKRGKQISTPRKIAYGMGIAAIAYIFLSAFSFKMGYPSSTEFLAMDSATQASMKAGPWVLIVLYFFLTVAELFISPLGLSFVSKVAPKSMQGLCQGLWLGATAVGNLFLFLGPKMYNAIPLGWCWGVFACLCLLSMGVMFGMVKWLERVTNS